MSYDRQKCFRCGRPGHFANRCNAYTTIDEDVCHRCGRPGHYESQCYAKTVVNTEGTYVLKSSDGRTYVGQSSNIPRRLEQHRTGNGARWTQEAEKPMRRVVTLVDSATRSRAGYSHETLETLEHIRRDGLEKVRGGPITQRNLTRRTEQNVQAMLRREYGGPRKRDRQDDHYSSDYSSDY